MMGGWIIFIFLTLSLLNTEFKTYFKVIGWFTTTVMLFLFSYHALFNQQSIIQSIIAIVSGFYTLFILKLIIIDNINIRQTTIFICISSGILLLGYTISTIQIALIYNVASETQYFLDLLGYNTELKVSDNGVYIYFIENSLQTEIIMACTGIGSIALFAGFISSIDTFTIKTKLIYIFISTSVIYLLNIVRNVFIAGAYGGQWFHIQPELIGILFGRTDEWVSFYIADRIIAQLGAVIVMVIFSFIIINMIHDKTKLIQELKLIIKHTRYMIK